MSTAFDRITKLLDQIAMEKSGRHDCPEPSVKDKVSEATTGAFASDDNAMISKANMRQPKYGHESELAAKHGQPRWAGTFTGTDPENENSKHIYDLTIDFRKYVNKSAAAEVPDAELLRDAAILGNSLLAEIIGEAPQQQVEQTPNYDPQGAVKAAAAATEQSPAQTNVANPQQEQQIPQQNTQVDPLQVIGLSGGVVYGLQKQAEYHADLVAQYLYGELYNKYAMDDKTVAEAVGALGGEGPVTAPSKEESEESSEAKDEDEEGTKKKEDQEEGSNQSAVTDEDTEEDSADESASDEEKAKDESSESSDEPGDAAGEALADHAAKGAVEDSLSDEDIMNSLGAALAELGMSPEELGQLGGPAGMKLASAFDDFRRKGKFKFEPARTKVKRAARDYIKGYILDLIRPGRA